MLKLDQKTELRLNQNEDRTFVEICLDPLFT
jgi:hypothetical protein